VTVSAKKNSVLARPTLAATALALFVPNPSQFAMGVNAGGVCKFTHLVAPGGSSAYILAAFQSSLMT